MFVVLGASGHVGHAVASALLDDGRPVLAVVHEADHAADLRDRGAEIAAIDLTAGGSLRDILRRGHRAFLLNPPALPATDTDAEEHRTARAIAAALEGSGLDKVVVASTYGAQPGDAIGDLSTLHDFERMVGATGIPAAINRGAYYYTNLDPLFATARKGELPSMFPAGLRLPMVSPLDLGRAAARRLASGTDDVGIAHVEGPARRSLADAAAAFAAALGRPVEVGVVPRDRWERTYRDHGFSPEAARAYVRMTAASVDGGFEMPADPIRGEVTLEDHVTALVGAG